MSDKYIELILQKVAENEISEENAYLLIKEYQVSVKKHQSNTVKSEGSNEMAIIGVACRMPGADTKEEYWNNLVKGRDCIREFPIERLRLLGKRAADTDSSQYMNAGYKDRIDTFDAGFFNIPPGEAKYIDPQQRLFLKTAYEAIEDAGYGWNSISNTNTGVYVGYSENKYGELIKNPTPTALVGNFPVVIPSRLSYIFNLSGPSVSIATACSSSLVALHMACEGIRVGDCDMAVAGGVILTILPGEKSKGGIGITSSDGRSKAFDASADGTGWGEGSGVVILKELSKAVKDHDYIYAVIKGSAINQDGASNEISSPKASAHTEVLVKAWESAGIDPQTISYIETHGTGTKIGDPIEIKGITDAFGKYTTRKQFCAIGSVKTNIGHLDSASGIAGLIKVIMMLKYRKIPPSLHFKALNPLINMIGSPVYINTRLTTLEDTHKPFRAGVSSFGLSGTNCHVILEEYSNAIYISESEKEQFIFTLSAKTKYSLKCLVDKYLKFIENNPKLGLAEMCHTVNTGRGHFNYRIAIISENCGELFEKLQKISEHEMEMNLEKCGVKNSIFYGCIDKAASNKIELEKQQNDMTPIEILAFRYVRGMEVDWSSFYKNKKLIKTPLPTYAYDEKSYWIKVLEDSKVNVELDYGKVILKGKEHEEDYLEEEKKLALIWSEILGLKEVNVNDSFFELGGDSLLAVEIVAELSKRFNCSVSLESVFAYPVICKLAPLISKQLNNNSGEIKPAEKSEYYPVSASQTRQYLLEQISGENTSYNMPVIMSIEGEIDFNKFCGAFKTLIKRHEPLRTSFLLIDNEVVQKVHDFVSFEVEVSEGNLEEIGNTIRGFIRPFDLSTAPLLRVRIHKLLDNRIFSGKYLFLFDIHHIISDGISMEVILTEFVELYKGNSLPKINIQYKDYAVWHNCYLKSDTVRKQREYWSNEFKGWMVDKNVPVLNMPLDFKRPSTASFEGEVVKFRIKTEMADEIRKFASDNGVSLYMLLLAVYNVILSEYSGQDDIVVGSLLAGRRQPGLKNTLGIFTNYLPIRNYPKADKVFMDFLQDVKNRMLKAFENQDVPFQEIIGMLEYPVDPSRNPIFDTMIVLHNQGVRLSDIKVDNMAMKTYDWKKHSATIDFKLDIFEEPDGALHCCIEYRNALFSKESMVSFSRHFTVLLEKAIREPFKKIKELKVLKSAECANLVEKRQKNIVHNSNSDQKTEVGNFTGVSNISNKEGKDSVISFRKRPNLRNQYVAPESELEVLVADVCRNVLKVDQVGIHDSFFDLGGNSMLAVRCISQLNTVLNRCLPPVSMFQRPTVSSLVELLNQNEQQHNQKIADDIEERERELAQRRNLLMKRRNVRQVQED